MSPEDQALVQDMVTKGVMAGLKSLPAPSNRSEREVGSPEFSEDRTQINSLNNKFIFASEINHFNDLNSRSLKSLDGLIDLQVKVNQKFFEGVDDRARLRDITYYCTMYDLSNPNTLGTSDTVRGGVIPQNRAIDTATAQSALNNTTIQTAIEAAIANAINGTIPTLEAAVGAAVAAALANVPVTPKA
jgi:hypothetical protein